MNTDVIKTLIEESTARISEKNPFMVRVKEGRIERREIAQYLYTLSRVFLGTIRHLTRAAERARECDRLDLARFFEAKIPEEAGHDRWAEADLAAFPEFKASDFELTGATRALFRNIEALIEEDPRLYLSYMTFVEYFTVLAAPAFLRAMEEKCGIPKSKMTAVDNHQTTDVKHVGEELEFFRGLLLDSQLVPRALHAVKQSSEWVGDVLSSCLRAPARGIQ